MSWSQGCYHPWPWFCQEPWFGSPSDLPVVADVAAPLQGFTIFKCYDCCLASREGSCCAPSLFVSTKRSFDPCYGRCNFPRCQGARLITSCSPSSVWFLDHHFFVLFQAANTVIMQRFGQTPPCPAPPAELECCRTNFTKTHSMHLARYSMRHDRATISLRKSGSCVF